MTPPRPAAGGGLSASTRRWLRVELERDAAREAAAPGVRAGVDPGVAPDATAVADGRARDAPGAEPGRTRGRFWLRVVVSLGMIVMAAGGLVAMTPAVVSLLAAGLILCAQGFVWVVRALSSGLDTWTILGRAGEALGVALASPEVTLLLVGVELAAVVALYGLHRVLAGEREKKRW